MYIYLFVLQAVADLDSQKSLSTGQHTVKEQNEKCIEKGIDGNLKQ